MRDVQGGRVVAATADAELGSEGRVTPLRIGQLSPRQRRSRSVFVTSKQELLASTGPGCEGNGYTNHGV